MVINFFMPYSKPFLSVLTLILIFACFFCFFVFKQKVLNVEMNFLPECINILMSVKLHAV